MLQCNITYMCIYTYIYIYIHLVGDTRGKSRIRFGPFLESYTVGFFFVAEPSNTLGSVKSDPLFAAAKDA